MEGGAGPITAVGGAVASAFICISDRAGIDGQGLRGHVDRSPQALTPVLSRSCWALKRGIEPTCAARLDPVGQWSCMPNPVLLPFAKPPSLPAAVSIVLPAPSLLK
jgi:hypothetical protein